MSAYARVDFPDPFGPMTACFSFEADDEVDTLDDLGAVLQGDVQVLDLELSHA